jgi:mono/diheme cytochrome c family protein
MTSRPRAALLFALALSGCEREDTGLPAAYRRVEVPEARLASAEARAHGRTLYLDHCALCHGQRANGRGPRREAFDRPPADFTDPAWRQRTSDRRLFFLINEGVRGTAMPSWRASLDEGEVWDLVAYVRSVARSGP